MYDLLQILEEGKLACLLSFMLECWRHSNSLKRTYNSTPLKWLQIYLRIQNVFLLVTHMKVIPRISSQSSGTQTFWLEIPLQGHHLKPTRYFISPQILRNKCRLINTQRERLSYQMSKNKQMTFISVNHSELLLESAQVTLQYVNQIHFLNTVNAFVLYIHNH